MMMECLDLDSSLMADSEIVQVDFLQDIQQNISKFQTLIEKLGARVDQLENTTSLHTRMCICMCKSVQQKHSTSSSPPRVAVANSGRPDQHPEIVRIDSNIAALNTKLEALRNDLVTLTGTGSSIRELKGHAPQTDKNVAVSSSSASRSSPATSTITASKLLNQRKTPHAATGSVCPPPPLLMRAPGPHQSTPTSSVGNSARHNIKDPQQKSQAELTPSSSGTFPKVEAVDDESEEDNISDEYEGEENAEDAEGNEEEDQDATFMQIQPEVILYDDDDDEAGGQNAYGQNGEDDLGDLGEQDEFDDEMKFDPGFGGEEEGPMVEIEFRDKLGNIIQCLAFEQTGKIKCPICDVQCMSRRNIIRHYNNKHADPKCYECSVCGAILNRKDSLTVHLRNQHNVIEQGGNFVLASPATDSLIEPATSASATVGGSTPKSSSGIQYSCNSCGKSFSRPDALTSHSCLKNGLVSTSTATSTKAKVTPIKQESNPSMLDPTITKKCPVCFKTFAVRSYLLRHLKAHTQNNQCVGCGKTYSRRDKLRAHQRKHHGQVLDDNYINQNLNMNETYDDDDGGGGDEGDDGIGDGDMSFEFEEDANYSNTPMWEFS